MHRLRTIGFVADRFRRRAAIDQHLEALVMLAVAGVPFFVLLVAPSRNRQQPRERVGQRHCGPTGGSIIGEMPPPCPVPGVSGACQTRPGILRVGDLFSRGSR
jgi:hypothetical protein